MCRLLLALGNHDASALEAGAKAMASGARAPAQTRVRRHPNGWGMIHRPFAEPRIRTWRAVTPLTDAPPFAQRSPGLTVIHARHATRPGTLGLDFTHPLERDNLFFFHNGYAPNVAQRLGRSPDSFDSRALFDWLAPIGSPFPSAAALRARLEAMGSGATSANCFLVSAEALIIANWFEVDPDFYTLWLLEDERGLVCASEILPELAPAPRWHPLGHGRILSLAIEGRVG